MLALLYQPGREPRPQVASVGLTEAIGQCIFHRKRNCGSLPGLNECVEDVVKGVRSTEAPDVGDARVSFTVEFKPAGK